MTITYTIQNKTDHALSIYPFSDLTGKALATRIQMDDTAIGYERNEKHNSVKINYKGLTGWVKLDQGVKLTVSGEPDPPPINPPPGKTLTHTIDIFSDGSIRIDGIAYP